MWTINGYSDLYKSMEFWIPVASGYFLFGTSRGILCHLLSYTVSQSLVRSLTRCKYWLLPNTWWVHQKGTVGRLYEQTMLWLSKFLFPVSQAAREELESSTWPATTGSLQSVQDLKGLYPAFLKPVVNYIIYLIIDDLWNTKVWFFFFYKYELFL